MRFRLQAMCLLAAACLIWSNAASLNAQSKAPKVQTRQVYVSVFDRFNTPITDLSAADFEVSENGVKREVVRAEMARSPMRIAMMIDTGDGMSPALNHLRAGMLAFADAIGPEHELMIVTMGRQVRVRLQPTTDRKKFKDSAAGLFMDGGATVLSDGLLEMDERFMRKAEDRWPVFVIVTADGAEGSAGANEKKFNDWIRMIPPRGLAVHGVAIKYKGGGTPDLYTGHVVETAGGLYDYINTSNSLPEKMKAIADRMTRDFTIASAKYEISFASPSPPGTPLVLGVIRPGVKFEMTQTRVR